MRINPEFFGDADNDEEFDPASKFKTIENLQDLPDDVLTDLTRTLTKVRSMLKYQEEEVGDTDSLLSFIAFQQLQIHRLQAEIVTVHEMLLVIASGLDGKADK
jgi:hypothetical protein